MSNSPAVPTIRINLIASNLCPGDHFLVSPGAGFMRTDKVHVTVESIERMKYTTAVHYGEGSPLIYKHRDVIENVSIINVAS